MRVAIIPARGGSKRIPRKNVRPFAGRPMIAYAIAAAREAGVFDRVVVSTDDAQIADLARAEGAEVPFMRPPELADDHTPTVPVIAHAARACGATGSPDETIACIYPAVPLLQPSDLRMAVELLESGRSPYVFPVIEFPSPIQRALRRDADGLTVPMDPSHVDTRTQDLEPAWYDAGQFYVGRSAAWLQGLRLHAGARTLIVASLTAVDIDWPQDWARAEILYEALRRQRPA
jgi:pseudaminic acid cytidylyltransferase